jgi:hypothetical protein
LGICSRATSLVVHQSSGSGSGTGISVQRLRCLVSAGALGPDDGNRDATLPRLGNHVGSAGWVSDADIADLAAACYPDPVPLELEEAAA